MSNYPLLPLSAPGRVSRNRFAILPAEYSLPPLPNEFRAANQPNESGQATFDAVAAGICLRINGSQIGSEKAALEQVAMEWLYAAVRRNVLRGRVFESQRMITERRADCLGYARLFELLGRNLGLDISIAEVIVDNAGRYVPHFVNLLRMSDLTTRFVDAWYGSTDIVHQRIGLQVSQNQDWVMRDVDSNEVRDFAGVRGIPPRCVYATILFMLGNRHLERSLRGDDGAALDHALRYYHTAIALYPENPRFYFNRAIAFENEGMEEEARSDYALALADESCLIRVLGRQHEEVLALIDLDEKGISQEDQEVYLLHKGFTTGTAIPIADVAVRRGVTVEQVGEVIKRVEMARTRA